MLGKFSALDNPHSFFSDLSRQDSLPLSSDLFSCRKPRSLSSSLDSGCGGSRFFSESSGGFSPSLLNFDNTLFSPEEPLRFTSRPVRDLRKPCVGHPNLGRSRDGTGFGESISKRKKYSCEDSANPAYGLTSRVYQGSLGSAKNADFIAQNRITHVFNFHTEAVSYGESLGSLIVDHRPIEDKVDVVILPQIRIFCEELNGIVSQNQDACFLIHCRHGLSRSGVYSAALIFDSALRDYPHLNFVNKDLRLYFDEHRSKDESSSFDLALNGVYLLRSAQKLSTGLLISDTFPVDSRARIAFLIEQGHQSDSSKFISPNSGFLLQLALFVDEYRFGPMTECRFERIKQSALALVYKESCMEQETFSGVGGYDEASYHRLDQLGYSHFYPPS